LNILCIPIKVGA